MLTSPDDLFAPFTKFHSQRANFISIDYQGIERYQFAFNSHDFFVIT